MQTVGLHPKPTEQSSSLSSAGGSSAHSHLRRAGVGSFFKVHLAAPPLSLESERLRVMGSYVMVISTFINFPAVSPDPRPLNEDNE